MRVRLRVVGRVQGVSFRASTLENATSLGLSGFVRNEADGTVTVEIEGASSKVDALIDWCRTGPPGAQVADVMVLQITPLYDRAPFVVK